ncbi:hypothetical protein AAC978_15375 [Desulfitobacterium sp. THU1]|uniref:hypothetical protein n=1 Tax=Desulfitobacterium sp. THU1 TaxID=3138072 RepID=UPI00311D6491
MTSRKFIVLFSFVFLMGMLLSGCGGSQTANKPTSNPPASANSETAIDPKENPAEAPNEKSKEAQENVNNTNGKVDELGDRLAKVYTDMLQSGKYYMKYRTIIEVDGEKSEAIMESAINGEDSAMISTMPEGKSHMVFRDNKTYLIDYESKTVLVIKSVESEADDLDTDGLLYKGNGKEDFLGKNLVYEEYTTSSGSMKYFFEGKKFVGMKVLAEGETVVMEILEMSDKYPADIFTIPANFTKEEM